MGLKLSKIHRVVSFTQKNRMAPYIQFNTEKRKEAKTDFFVNFWKLMNVQLFGKTIEQCRNRKDVQLVCDPGKAKKLGFLSLVRGFSCPGCNITVGFSLKYTVELINSTCTAVFLQYMYYSILQYTSMKILQ
jgi:hypothetical protein